VPLAIMSLVILHKYLHVETIRRKIQIDYFGAILIAIAASLPRTSIATPDSTFLPRCRPPLRPSS